MLLVGIGLVVVGRAIAPPLGLKAAYFASANGSGTVERSTDFSSLTDATRIDPDLDLRGEAFGVYFFNDASRFNFGADVQPGRDQLQFSVRWDGWLLAPSDGARRFVVQSTGPARVWVDEQQLASAEETLDVTTGLHQVRVEYTRPETRVPALSVKWQRTPGGELEQIGGADVRWKPDAGSPMLAAALGVLGWVLVAAGIAFGIALAGRRLLRTRRVEGLWRLGLVLLPLGFLVY